MPIIFEPPGFVHKYRMVMPEDLEKQRQVRALFDYNFYEASFRLAGPNEGEGLIVYFRTDRELDQPIRSEIGSITHNAPVPV